MHNCLTVLSAPGLPWLDLTFCPALLETEGTAWHWPVPAQGHDRLSPVRVWHVRLALSFGPSMLVIRSQASGQIRT